MKPSIAGWEGAVARARPLKGEAWSYQEAAKQMLD